jgi:hypothetical protein
VEHLINQLSQAIQVKSRHQVQSAPQVAVPQLLVVISSESKRVLSVGLAAAGILNEFVGIET